MSRREFTCPNHCTMHPKHQARMYQGNYKGNVDYVADQMYRMMHRGYCQAGDTNVCDRAQQMSIHNVKPYGPNPHAPFQNTHHQRKDFMLTFPQRRYKKYNNTLVYTQLKG